jgi:hypothetical protein
MFPSPDIEDGPMTATLTFRLPDASIIAANLPEEHAILRIKNGQVWTFGDLCMRDPDLFYTGLRHRTGRIARFAA